MTTPHIERIPTLIPGLDRLIDGGFVRGSANLLLGSTGTGKTLFAMQWACNQALHGRNTLYLSFDEDLEDVARDAQSIGLDVDRLRREHRLLLMTFSHLAQPNLHEEFAKVIKGSSIASVVIDGMDVFSLAFQDNHYKMRKELLLVLEVLRLLGCTALLTADTTGNASLDLASSSSLTAQGVLEVVADSVIILSLDGKGKRGLRILKMRRTEHTHNTVAFKLGKRGVAIGK